MAFRSHEQELAEERERVARKSPHLALVPAVKAVPQPAPEPERDCFSWIEVEAVTPIPGEK